MILDENCEWKAEVTDLPKYKDGKEITYSITEDEIKLYAGIIEGDQKEGFIINNFYKPEGGENPKTADNITTNVITLFLSIIGISYSFYLRKRYN